MQEWLQEINWLTSNLAFGEKPTENGYQNLARIHRVKRIIDLRETQFAQEALSHQTVCIEDRLQILHLPTQDLGPIDLDKIWTGVRWANEAFDLNERVYIHCEHGIGRSALLACCVLVSLGNSPLYALKLAKSIRKKTSPSPIQLHCFISWSTQWYSSVGIPAPFVTWDQLADIAYDHANRTTAL